MFTGGTTLALRLPSCRCRPPPTQAEPQLSSPLIQISPVSQSPQVSKTTQVLLFIQKYTLSACWRWGTVLTHLGIQQKIRQMQSPPSNTPFMLLSSAHTFRSTAENSAPWQSRGGRRMLLSLFRMALDHVRPWNYTVWTLGSHIVLCSFFSFCFSHKASKPVRQPILGWQRLKPSCPPWSSSLSSLGTSYSFFNENPKAAMYINWWKHTLVERGVP